MSKRTEQADWTDELDEQANKQIERTNLNKLTNELTAERTWMNLNLHKRTNKPMDGTSKWTDELDEQANKEIERTNGQTNVNKLEQTY